jgi:hypothetical protein
MIPETLYRDIKLHEKEVIEAYSDFNIIEIPAGYDGEVGEAYANLIKVNIQPSFKNIITYLKAKGQIMSILRKEEKLVQTYLDKYPEERIGGIIIPEWLIALQIIFSIIASGVTIASILKKIFGKKIEEKEIQRVHNEIYNIKEVKTLIILRKQVESSQTAKEAR